MKQNPNLLRSFLPNLRMAIGYLTAWATLAGSGTATPQQVLDSWLDRCNDVSGLRDANHLSLAEHCGARTFVTGDADYKRVASLPVPMQVIML
jgi:hypothetical protein